MAINLYEEFNVMTIALSYWDAIFLTFVLAIHHLFLQKTFNQTKMSVLGRKVCVLLGQRSSRCFLMKMSPFFSFGNSEILRQLTNPPVTIKNKVSGCWVNILKEKALIFLLYFMAGSWSGSNLLIPSFLFCTVIKKKYIP